MAGYSTLLKWSKGIQSFQVKMAAGGRSSGRTIDPTIMIHTHFKQAVLKDFLKKIYFQFYVQF